ncbi:hypothetical protein RFI_37771, partial [Reticulomyxa filosa]
KKILIFKNYKIRYFLKKKLEDSKMSLKFANGMFNEKRKMFEPFFLLIEEKHLLHLKESKLLINFLFEKLFLRFFVCGLKKKQNKIKTIVIEKSIILKRTYFSTFDVHIIGIQKKISTQFVHVTILTLFFFSPFSSPPPIVLVIFLKNISVVYKFVCICTRDDTKQERFAYKESGDLSGGMQHNTETNKNAKEIKALMTLFGDAIDESELKKRLEENNGNVVLVIEQLTSKLMHRETKESEEKEHSKEVEKKTEKVKKDEDNEN